MVAASSAFPASGSYSYAAALNGAPVGRWSVTVKQTGDGTEIDENSNASLQGIALGATATLTLAGDLSPSKYAGSYHTLGQNPMVSVTLTPNSASVAPAGGGAAQTLALDPSTKHFIVVEEGLLAGLFALPAQLQSWKDTSVTWISPMNAAAVPVPTNPAPPTQRPANVPAADVALALAGQIPVTIWYDPATLVPDEILVPSENAVLTRLR